MNLYAYDSAREFLGREPYDGVTGLSERDRELLLALVKDNENDYNDGLLGYQSYAIATDDRHPFHPVLIISWMDDEGELLVARYGLSLLGGAAGPVDEDGTRDERKAQTQAVERRAGVAE